MTIGFVKHLHTVSHNLHMAELLKRRDQLLDLYDTTQVGTGSPLIRKALNIATTSLLQQIRDLEEAYAALSDRLREPT